MKITVNDVEMELDVEKALSLGLLQPTFKHHIGNHYLVNDGGNDLYVLAVVDVCYAKNTTLMALIDISSGSRKTDPREVKNCLDLTLDEWESICTTSPDRVRYVPPCDVAKELEKTIQNRF